MSDNVRLSTCAMPGENQASPERDAATLADSHESDSRPRSLRKHAGFTVLFVALTVVVSIAAAAAGKTDAFAWPAPAMDEVAPSTSEASPHCALKYAAVLDLAELARRYGKASPIYLHAFNKVAAQMNACGRSERYAAS
jgi:hypothetical protein